MANTSMIMHINLNLRYFRLFIFNLLFFSLNILKRESGCLLAQFMIFLDVRVSLVVPCRVTLELVQENIFSLRRLA
jgi:hypothetical protein